MSDFEWRTDEEWSEEVVSAEIPRRRWWQWGLFGCLLLLVGGAALWQLRGRVQAAVQKSEDEVIASYNLLYSAVQSGDTELAYTFLSGSDQSWTRQVQTRISARTWLAWPELGWEMVGEPSIVGVEMGSDLRSAELTLALTYRFNGNPFTLHHTLTFRQGETHWLYAPPAESLWANGSLMGEQTDGFQLKMVHLDRDAALVERLQVDIYRAREQISRSQSGRQIAFPEIVAWLSDYDYDSSYALDTGSGVTNLSLPAPSVIGIPLDEVGYQALLAAYNRFLLAFPTVTNFSDDCCQHTVFAQALGEHVMAEAGVPVVQLTAHDYTRVLQGNGAFDNRLLGWQSAEPTPPTTDDWRTARAVVEYIHETIPMYAVSRQMGSSLNQFDSFDEWLKHVMFVRALSSQTPATGTETEPSFAGFQAFLIERGASLVDHAPYDLPTAQPVLACDTITGGGRLYAYDFAGYRWDNLLETEAPITAIHTLDQPNTLWLEQGGTAAGVWKDGAIMPQNAPLLWFSAEWQTPDTPTVVMRQELLDNELIENHLAINFFWLDPNRCDSENGCELTPIEGIPHWSPNREHILFADLKRGLLTVTDAQRNVLYTRTDITTLDTVIWIDDTHYAWRNPTDGAYYRSNIESSTPQHWFSITNLRPILPLSEQQLNPQLHIFSANTVRDPYLLIMQVYEGNVPQHLVSYNHVTGEMRYLVELSYNEYIGISPFGRYHLAARPRPSTVMRLSTSLNLLNRATMRLESLPYGEPAPFSEDWLLLSDSDQLRLIAPFEQFGRLIPLPAENCTAATWLLRE